jgi:hypothetical protein
MIGVPLSAFSQKQERNLETDTVLIGIAIQGF